MTPVKDSRIIVIVFCLAACGTCFWCCFALKAAASAVQSDEKVTWEMDK